MHWTNINRFLFSLFGSPALQIESLQWEPFKFHLNYICKSAGWNNGIVWIEWKWKKSEEVQAKQRALPIEEHIFDVLSSLIERFSMQLSKLMMWIYAHSTDSLSTERHRISTKKKSTTTTESKIYWFFFAHNKRLNALFRSNRHYSMRSKVS